MYVCLCDGWLTHTCVDSHASWHVASLFATCTPSSQTEQICASFFFFCRFLGSMIEKVYAEPTDKEAIKYKKKFEASSWNHDSRSMGIDWFVGNNRDLPRKVQ